MDEAGEDFGDVDLVEVVEEFVRLKFDEGEIFDPSCPGRKPLPVRVSLDGGPTGILRSYAQRNNSISCGRGAILKDRGSWDGTDEKRRLVISLLFK